MQQCMASLLYNIFCGGYGYFILGLLVFVSQQLKRKFIKRFRPSWSKPVIPTLAWAELEAWDGGDVPTPLPYPKGSFRCMNHSQSAFDKPVELHWWTNVVISDQVRPGLEPEILSSWAERPIHSTKDITAFPLYSMAFKMLPISANMYSIPRYFCAQIPLSA
jgi:hypothetical protein